MTEGEIYAGSPAETEAYTCGTMSHLFFSKEKKRRRNGMMHNYQVFHPRYPGKRFCDSKDDFSHQKAYYLKSTNLQFIKLF